MTIALVALAVVAATSTVGMIITVVLWQRSLRFFVNTAVSRNTLELAQRQQITEPPKPKTPKEPRPRPEGI